MWMWRRCGEKQSFLGQSEAWKAMQKKVSDSLLWHLGPDTQYGMSSQDVSNLADHIVDDLWQLDPKVPLPTSCGENDQADDG